jgi:hypothetical protein
MATPATASGVVRNGFVRVDPRYALRALPNEDIFLYSKPIDNSRVVREAGPASRGEWSMIGTACAVALLFMGLMTPRVLGTFAGYRLEALKVERQHLLDEQRDLNIVEARISRQENLEALAKRRDLNTPTSGQVVHLEPKSDNRLALNRH